MRGGDEREFDVFSDYFSESSQFLAERSFVLTVAVQAKDPQRRLHLCHVRTLRHLAFLLRLLDRIGDVCGRITLLVGRLLGRHGQSHVGNAPFEDVSRADAFIPFPDVDVMFLHDLLQKRQADLIEPGGFQNGGQVRRHHHVGQREFAAAQILPVHQGLVEHVEALDQALLPDLIGAGHVAPGSDLDALQETREKGPDLGAGKRVPLDDVGAGQIRIALVGVSVVVVSQKPRDGKGVAELDVAVGRCEK